jgi:hypothetical protein
LVPPGTLPGHAGGDDHDSDYDKMTMTVMKTKWQMRFSGTKNHEVNDEVEIFGREMFCGYLELILP